LSVNGYWRRITALIIYLIRGTNLSDRRSVRLYPRANYELNARVIVERRQKNELNEARFNMNDRLSYNWSSDRTYYPRDNNLYFCASPCSLGRG